MTLLVQIEYDLDQAANINIKIFKNIGAPGK
jgi:hypothetical protein